MPLAMPSKICFFASVTFFDNPTTKSWSNSEDSQTGLHAATNAFLPSTVASFSPSFVSVVAMSPSTAAAFVRISLKFCTNYEDLPSIETRMDS